MRIDPNQFMEIKNKSQSFESLGSYSVTLEHTKEKKTESLSGHVPVIKESTYQKPSMDSKEEIEAMAEVAADSSEAKRNSMAVLSNSMSEEDFREFRKNGGSVMDEEPEAIVTVVDKIKIHLAENGIDTGKITAGKEAIESVSGGRLTSDQAMKILSAADFPPTNENVSDTRKAYELAASIDSLSDGAVKYMVENDLSGTIENLYYAKNGAGTSSAMNILDERAASDMDAQLRQVIESASLPVTEETLSESRWMVANDLPLTEENLVKVDALRHFSLPVEKEEIFASITEALSEGKRPQDAELLQMTKRSLELSEAQLKLTEEARLSMERRGFSVDTEQLREKVAALREQETALYEKLLADDNGKADPVSVETMRETMEAVDEIKLLPAAALSIPDADTNELRGIQTAGRALKARMELAGERYEQMGTEVRRDLGDSIQKAFRNTDELLKEVGLPETEANERAVRILGYNRIEITEENVLAMKAKDEEVQRALKSLTPSVVAEMVKEKISPLDLPLRELNQKAAEIGRETGIPEEESYAEFLIKLEHNKEISIEERESYLGIFRLIHQVEKSDGAAVGALVAANAEVTMRSLLSAVRTEKKAPMDYKVDDSFSGVQGKTDGKDIISQIGAAFDETFYQTEVIRDIAEEISPEALRTVMKKNAAWEEMPPEAFREALREADTQEEELLFARSKMEEFAKAASTEAEVYRMLERYDLPATAANILTMQQFSMYPNAAIRRLFGANIKDYRDENGEVDFDEIKSSLLEEFGEAVSEPEELAKAEKRLADTAENVMKTMLSEEGGVKSELDIRSLRMMTNRFRIAGRMAEGENYHIPVLVRGETGEINLKIVSGTEEKGMVDILFSLSSLGSVAAKLRAEGGKLTGFVASNSRETVDLFSARGEELLRSFRGIEGIESVSLHPVFDESLDLRHFDASTEEENERYREENGGKTVRTKTLYQIAKNFISALKRF